MAISVSKALLSCGLTSAVLMFSASTAIAGSHYSVDLNKTEIVYLPTNAGAVIVGNPEIADVSVHSANTLFVIGRGYGETNLIVLDGTGQTIMNADIQVVQNIPSHGVRLFNAKNRETYSCTPYCLPAPVLGDTKGFISKNSGGGDRINNNASTAMPTTPVPGSFTSSSSTPPSQFAGPPLPGQ